MPARSPKKSSSGTNLASQGNVVPASAHRKVLGDDDLIKQPQRASPAGRAILAIGKAIYVLGAFAAFHFVKCTQMTPLELVASTLTVSAALLCALHKPWRLSKGRGLNTETMLLCWKTAACTVVVHWLLAFGLVACAPVRFLILEHLEVLVTYCLGMLLGAKQVQSTKVQGGLLIFAGYVVCLWHDTTPIRASGVVDEVDETNTYDSFVGTCAIGLASFVAVTARRTERQLVAQLGSLKRVHALQAVTSLTVLWPLVALEWLFHPGPRVSPELRPTAFYTYSMLLFVAFTFCTFRFVLASMQQSLRVPESQAARTSVVVVTVCALFIHTLHSWDTLIAPQSTGPAILAAAPVAEVNVGSADLLLANETPAQALSPQLEAQPTPAPPAAATVEAAAGSDILQISDSSVQAAAAPVSSGMSMSALQAVASSEDASSAFAVYVAAALVAAGVFRFTMDGGEEQLSRLAQRVLPLLVTGGAEGLMLPVRDDGGGAAKDSAATRLLRQLWRHRATRRPLGYLVVSLAFASLESVYGWAVGATCLIADAAHVLVDCAAACVSLAAAHLSTRPPSSTYSYGGARAEVLGGFVNGLMIFVAASSIVTGAAHRSRGPGTQGWASERLLIVHVLGLGINACGLALFNEGNPESGMPRVKRPSQNMRGMYLHVLADTLGTIVIVVSSLMRHYFGWMVLDPIASVVVACFLVTQAVPLLKATALVLLQRQPPQLDAILEDTMGQVKGLKGVEGCHTPHFWCLTPRHLAEGSLKVAVSSSLPSEQCGTLLGRVSELFRPIEARVLVELERSSPSPII